MPYKVFQDGERYCVHKLNADDSKGKQIGCHDSKEGAAAQVRALYANENKELFMIGIETLLDQEMETKEREESLLAMLSEYEDRQKIGRRSDVSAAERERAVEEYGDVEYADSKNKKYPIDTAAHIKAAWNYIGQKRNQAKYSAEEVASIKRRIIAAWKKKIDPAGPPSAKKSLLEAVIKKLGELADMVKSIGADEDSSDMLIFKGDDGAYRWVGRYSNNFRDDDNPPEIISEKSHLRFVELVDQGIAPLPELLLWHQKEWSIGQADWVAYDNGFAMAGGRFHPDLNDVAEALSAIKELGMSHGMPSSTIKRDPSDNSIIIEHESREISVLQPRAAANRLTGFVVVDKEEDMNPKDRKKLTDWGLSDEIIERIEGLNLADSEKGAEEGRETKEVETEEVQAEATEVTPTEEATDATEQQAEDASDEVDIAAEFDKALQKALKPLFDRQEQFEASFQQSLEALKADLQGVKEQDEAKIAKAISGTPQASLMALFNQGVESVIGREEARQDGRESLAKSKPKEAVPLNTGPTPVPFINELINPQAS